MIFPTAAHRTRNRPGRKPAPWRAAAAACFCLMVATWAAAAEFQLRQQCAPQGSIVTLGDVAQIHSADPDQAAALAKVELFHAPAAGHQRYLRVREIQDTLLERGYNLAEHRFSGASQVAVQGRVEAAPVVRQQRVHSVDTARAVRQVREAIVAHLAKTTQQREAWNVQIELSDRDARTVLKAVRGISVRGGSAPWTGKQSFEASLETPEGATVLPLVVDISRPPAAVVAARNLPRGVVLRAEDLQVVSAAGQEEVGEVFRSVEQVVGMETIRPLSEGRVLDRNSVHAPIVVRRGEAVTVYARSAGIRVRTVARAREDGGLGDLIAVESMQNRKTYFARVSGVQEVEVYAQAVSTPPPDADVPSSARVVKR